MSESGYVTRAGTVEIVADLFVVGREGLGNGSGGSSDNQKSARDFLTSPDSGKRTKDRLLPIIRAVRLDRDSPRRAECIELALEKALEKQIKHCPYRAERIAADQKNS